LPSPSLLDSILRYVEESGTAEELQSLVHTLLTHLADRSTELPQREVVKVIMQHVPASTDFVPYLTTAIRGDHLWLFNLFLDEAPQSIRDRALCSLRGSNATVAVAALHVSQPLWDRLLALGCPLSDQAIVNLAQANKSAILESVLMTAMVDPDALLPYVFNADADHGAALQVAAQDGLERIVKLLLWAGANVDIGDQGALRFAVRRGHITVVEELLAHGARVTKRVLAWSRDRQEDEIVDLLRDAVEEQGGVDEGDQSPPI
jgi:hypothetical protein